MIKKNFIIVLLLVVFALTFSSCIPEVTLPDVQLPEEKFIDFGDITFTCDEEKGIRDDEGIEIISITISKEGDSLVIDKETFPIIANTVEIGGTPYTIAINDNELILTNKDDNSFIYTGEKQ